MSSSEREREGGGREPGGRGRRWVGGSLGAGPAWLPAWLQAGLGFPAPGLWLLLAGCTLVWFLRFFQQ